MARPSQARVDLLDRAFSGANRVRHGVRYVGCPRGFLVKTKKTLVLQCTKQDKKGTTLGFFLMKLQLKLLVTLTFGGGGNECAFLWPISSGVNPFPTIGK